MINYNIFNKIIDRVVFAHWKQKITSIVAFAYWKQKITSINQEYHKNYFTICDKNDSDFGCLIYRNSHLLNRDPLLDVTLIYNYRDTSDIKDNNIYIKKRVKVANLPPNY